MKILDVLIVISFILIFISLAFSIFFISSNAELVSAKVEQSYVIVKVTDENGKPIENAKVTIIESKTSHITDKNGQTQKILVPLYKDNRFDYLAPKTFSEITIVAKASGYASHIMYNVKVSPNSVRSGVVIKLKTIINPEDSKTIISDESPDEGFSNLIVDKLA